MTTYEEARDTLVEALGPVAAYVERAHATVDAADPTQTGKLRHVTQIEALIEAVADFGEVVDAKLNPVPYAMPAPLAGFAAKIRAHLAQPHMQERARLTLSQRQALASINSNHLQFPDHARPL